MTMLLSTSMGRSKMEHRGGLTMMFPEGVGKIPRFQRLQTFLPMFDLHS